MNKPLTQRPFRNLYTSKEDELFERAIHHLYRTIDCIKKIKDCYAKKDTHSSVIINDRN